MTCLIASGTRMGPVALSVADLDRSIAWYGGPIGLRELSRDGRTATLGADDTPLVVLHEEPGAVPSTASAGLFHLALLLPTRADLAHWLGRAIDARVPLDGLSDHVVSEAVYLTDPDGHGIEIYADRDRAVWEGRVAELMGTFALDVPDLLAAGDAADGAADGMPAGTTMGHVHLRVADIAASMHFHRDVIGWELITGFGPSAAFLGADGYHHHIGMNTWQSAGRRVGGPGETRLLHATIVLPDAAAREAVLERVRAAGGAPVAIDGDWEVEDPAGIRLRLAVD